MEQEPTKILAVLFGADGVVQTTQAGWLERLGRLTEKPQNTERFLSDIFEAERPSLTGSHDFAQSLAEVLDKWGSKSTVAEALEAWTMIDPDQAILDLIASVRSPQALVALGTNQQSYRLDYMLNELNYTTNFDYILCSCELGYAKPSAEYFESAMATIGLSPMNALFIDDHPTNVESAKAAGLHAEKYHLSEGVSSMMRLLRRYGLEVG